MFIEVVANFWCNLEHHTTQTCACVAGESDFCRFLENDTPIDSEYPVSFRANLTFKFYSKIKFRKIAVSQSIFVLWT